MEGWGAEVWGVADTHIDFSAIHHLLVHLCVILPSAVPALAVSGRCLCNSLNVGMFSSSLSS